MQAIPVEPNAHQRIYITGMPGSGKSTIGKKLARVLGWEFIDLDKLIEQHEGMSVPAIFEQKGEPYFRQAEQEALFQTSEYTCAVIACGGGTPYYNNNIDWINQHGLSIYLHGTVSAIYRRISQAKTTRPLFENLDEAGLRKKISAIIQQREPSYRLSKIIVELPVKSVETLAKQALSAIAFNS